MSAALKYWGTNIPPNLAYTFRMNFPPLLRAVRSLLDKWTRGLHSWFGHQHQNEHRAKVYLFQTLPISSPSTFFHQINTLFTKFIWAHKRPRINRRLLALPKIHGGVAVRDTFSITKQPILVGKLTGVGTRISSYGHI